MTRGRKPKPTHLKLIEGNPGKRPIRTGPERPVTTMPEPPDHLNADARTEWDRPLCQRACNPNWMGCIEGDVRDRGMGSTSVRYFPWADSGIS